LFVKTPKILRYVFPSLVWRKENLQNKIWLTFDDGPEPEATNYILKVLKDEKIKATFFLIGQQIEKHPKLFENIIAAGHMVANHSYSHKDGWLCHNSIYLEDIEKCQKLMPRNRLFRPPYGRIPPLQIKNIKKKYKIILWDVLSWDFSANINSRKVKENILRNTVSGSILVLHNNKKSLSNLKSILKETIQELKQQGFKFSTTW
tara:strand:- start:596 stop:1207 length:612 start_codon:yes stop_codon:yes gene_type:complete